MGKKIKESERPAEFSRIRDIVFKSAKIPYSSNNSVQYEIYRRALRRFGLVDDSMQFQYPDTVGGYDLRSEEGITSLMDQVAKEYSEIDKGITEDPASMRDVLWPLFTTEHNPNYQDFVDGELASVDMDYAQLDKILKAGESDVAKATAAAKGTSLEGTVGNPFDLAENLQYKINLRYIESFGYKLAGFKEKASKEALFDEVQRNLADGAPYKLSKEEQSARDMAELKAKLEGGAINSNPIEKSGFASAGSSSINSYGEDSSKRESVPASSAPINPAESKTSTETKTAEAATSAAVTSAPAEVTKETAPPPAETILNVNLEKEVTPAPAAGSTQTTINNQATVEAPKEVSSSSEKVESSTNTILKTDSTKSTAINETKEKNGKFSSFLEKASESKIGKAINLGGIVSDIKDQAKDFGAVTKSELGLGKGGPLSKLGTGALNLVDRLKESKKEKSTVLSDNTTASTSSASINATTSEKTSTDTEKILSEKPGVSTSTSTSETIEKNKMIVKPEPVAPIVPPAQVTQNVETSNTSQTNQTSAPTTATSQTTNVENQGSNQTTNTGASPGISMPNFAEMERLLSNIQKILVLGIDELKTEKYD